jgi:hypothetical protein
MSEEIEKQLEQAALGVLQMFAAVCGDPDNPEVTTQADEALVRLDGLLAAVAAS